MKKQVYFPVRLPHLLRHCAPGAIVRTEDELVVVKDISHWTDKSGNLTGEEITRVRCAKETLGLGEKRLISPPVARVLDNGRIEGTCVPSLRFPTWYVCSDQHCGRLVRIFRKADDSHRSRCPCDKHSDKKKAPFLEQVPWVMVHSEGYLADLDFHFLAHRNSKGNKCEDRNHLSIKVSSGAAFVICGSTGCGAKGKLEERMPISFGITRKQPWIKDSTAAKEPAIAVQVNDPSVHMTQTKSALVIPPESRVERGSVLDRLHQDTRLQHDLRKARNQYQRRGIEARAARQLQCSLEELHRCLEELEKGYPLYGQKCTSGEGLKAEWQALHEELPDLREEEDFVPRERTKDLRKVLANERGFSDKYPFLTELRLVAVERLRKIEVLTGFTRGSDKNRLLVPPDLENKLDWLPAIELFGEGLFLSLPEFRLRKWEKQVKLKKYVDITLVRYLSTALKFEIDPEVTPRFLLLHTLSHLLMRQLESSVGYPAASFQEKIYSSVMPDLPMAGILIYIAVPDQDGTLGGLVKITEPTSFLKLMDSALASAKWCSLDPVCSEHEGQGPALLNRAACHACCLVPDPSCAYGNVLLDRAMLNGSKEHGFKGFLDYAEGKVE